MQYKCDVCHDTGSRDKSGDYLDCKSCEAPAERMALESFIEKLPAMGGRFQVWMVHQRALAMAPKQEAPEASNFELQKLKEAAKRAGMANHFIDGKLRDDMFVIGKDFIERLHAELENFCPPIAAPEAANGALTDAMLPEKMSEEMREAMWEAITRHGLANLEYWIEDLYNDIRNAAIALSGAKGN